MGRLCTLFIKDTDGRNVIMMLIFNNIMKTSSRAKPPENGHNIVVRCSLKWRTLVQKRFTKYGERILNIRLKLRKLWLFNPHQYTSLDWLICTPGVCTDPSFNFCNLGLYKVRYLGDFDYFLSHAVTYWCIYLNYISVFEWMCQLERLLCHFSSFFLKYLL